DVHKFVNLFTWDWIPVDASSEQHIFKNQRNQFNFVQDEDAQASANITGSAATTTGIVLINQAPGSINNQGNQVSVTFAESPGNVGYRPQPSPVIDSTPLSFTGTPQVAQFNPETAGVFAHAEVSVQQVNGADPPTATPPTDDTATTFPSSGITLEPGSFSNEYINVDPSTLSDTIDSSLNGGTGVVGVNQAAGSLNNQNNALAVALGDHVVHALGEADLGQFNSFNEVNVIDQIRTDTISGGSLSSFSGVAMVNQASG